MGRLWKGFNMECNAAYFFGYKNTTLNTGTEYELALVILVVILILFSFFK